MGTAETPAPFFYCRRAVRKENVTIWRECFLSLDRFASLCYNDKKFFEGAMYIFCA